jgi:hypothetical protein
MLSLSFILTLLGLSDSFIIHNKFIPRNIKPINTNLESKLDSFCIFHPFSLINNNTTTFLQQQPLLIFENITTDDGEVPWF